MENVTLKLNFALSLVPCDYSMLITLYKIGGVHFRLLGTNGFHVKAKNERFPAASSRCRQNFRYENFTSSFGRLRQNIAPKSVPHVQHDYFLIFFFHSTNEIIGLWRCRWRSRRPILNSLLATLSKHDDDSNKNLTNLHIWQWKTVFLHALHVHILSLDILKTFSSIMTHVE